MISFFLEETVNDFKYFISLQNMASLFDKLGFSLDILNWLFS